MHSLLVCLQTEISWCIIALERNGDEDAELENEIREVEEIGLIQANQQLLAQEWDTLETRSLTQDRRV
jgi:hypothetical protein